MEEILKQILERLDSMEKSTNERFDKIEADIKDIKKDIIDIKEDIEEIKEYAEETRFAANRNGEKLEEVINELNTANITSIKY